MNAFSEPLEFMLLPSIFQSMIEKKKLLHTTAFRFLVSVQLLFLLMKRKAIEFTERKWICGISTGNNVFFLFGSSFFHFILCNAVQIEKIAWDNHKHSNAPKCILNMLQGYIIMEGKFLYSFNSTECSWRWRKRNRSYLSLHIDEIHWENAFNILVESKDADIVSKMNSIRF